MEPSEGQLDKYASKPGASEPWYKDSDFVVCPTCDSPGRMAPDEKGRTQFFHRVDRGNGYFGFDAAHNPKGKK
jgi:hypothetical protein